MNLVARRAPHNWSPSKEILVPGQQGLQGLDWLARFAVTYTLPSDHAFPFGPALVDIARRHDLPTARFAAKRLEYRMAAVPISGRGWWSTAVVHRPISLALFGIAAVAVLERLRVRGRRRRLSQGGAAGDTSPSSTIPVVGG
jgi:hypothetical protein